MAVAGDLSSKTQLEIKKHGSFMLVDDIHIENFKNDGRQVSERACSLKLLQFCASESLCGNISTFDEILW